MSILGIIAEYNPLHQGHVYHIKASKAITGAKYTVAVMSGNFVQRGEPAIIDKFARTKMALLAGVDLVLELPVFSATASAEFFALGAVKLLEATGIVEKICFGSESGKLEQIDYIANILLHEEIKFKQQLKQKLSQGQSYPKAREMALQSAYGQNFAQLQTSNNILAVEYLKALKKINSAIKPYTIKRLHSNYNDLSLNKPYASATAIRRSIFLGDIESVQMQVPDFAYEGLMHYAQSGSFAALNNLSQVLHYILRTQSTEQLKKILGMQEGIEQRIVRIARTNLLISDIIQQIKTKRYTFTKIQRLILHILLNITTEEFNDYNLKETQYIRILGFKESSAEILKLMQERAKAPIIANIKNVSKLAGEGVNILNKEIQTTDIYNISLNPPYREDKWEYSIPMIKVP